MSVAKWQLVGLASAGLALMLACRAERITETAPSDPAGQLDGIAIRLEVNLRDSTIRIVTPATAPARGAEGITPAFAILGGNEVSVTTTNLTRVTIPGNKVRVSFDAAITNRLTSASLVPPTFPSGTGGSTGLLLFPYRVTQVVGAAASQVIASIDWNGDGSAGSGAPRNFFNDFGCPVTGVTSDCLRWEQYPAPLFPGDTTPKGRVGFDMPKAVSSFQVLLVLAADVSNDLPAVARLSVTPSSYVMNDGFAANFSAVAYDAQNNPLPWVTIRWTSPDITAVEFQYGSALVGSIAGPSVIVHGRKVGLTSFTARTGGITVTVPLDIQVNTIVLVQLYTHPDSDLVVGEQVQGDVRIKDNSGNIVPGFVATWSTSDPNVATVDANGLITAVGPGSVTITATAAAASGSVPLTVTAAAPGYILGFITDPIGGIGGITLSTHGISGVTNASGSFNLTGVPAGPTTLTLSNMPAGCTTTSVPVVVPPGGGVSPQIDPGCTAGLHVTVSSFGIGPLAGGYVYLNANLHRTDSNGELLFTGVASRVVQVDAYDVPAGCMQPALLSAVPTIGGVAQANVDVACPGPARLSGVVTATGFTQFDGTPVPAPGVAIFLARRNEFPATPSAIAGTDGSYVIDPAQIGPASIQNVGWSDPGANCGNIGGLPINLLGRSDVALALQAFACQAHTVRVKLQDLSAVPSLPAVDLRIRSALTGSTFGGTLANDGSTTDFPILADDAAFQVYLDNLPQGCSATSSSGVADRLSGLTSVTLTLQCS